MNAPSLHDIADALYRAGRTSEYEAFMRLIKLLTRDQILEWEKTA